MPTNLLPNPIYSDAEWLKSAHKWIGSQLEVARLHINGPIEQPHIRPWSTVLYVPTNAGLIVFKATIEAWRHEAGLTQAISRYCPDLTPQVLAADFERNWMLMRHGGESLRSLLKRDHDILHWKRALALYARLQRSLSPHAQELIALGADDRRLAILPDLYARLLDDPVPLHLGREGGLTVEEHVALLTLASRFATYCKRLADFGIEETIQHDDLHDNNILVNPFGGEPYLFFDWGDSCVSHPFFSLVLATKSMSWNLGLDHRSEAILAVHRSYCQAWENEHTIAELDQARELAMTLGIVCRALTWRKLLPGVDLNFESDLGNSVAHWMREYLEYTRQDQRAE